jgi:hypothetical protein
MKTSTTIALSVVALGLLGYIYFYERKTVSTGETEFRTTRLLPTFVRDKVERIEIKRAEGTTVLERSAVADRNANAVAPDAWNLAAPVKGAADGESVDALLSAVEWAEARRSLTELSAADLATFGLSKPRVEAKFVVLGSPLLLRIGGEDPKGQGFYAATDDGSRAFVVGKDLAEALDIGAEGLRDKNVLRDADPENADRMVVRAPAQTADVNLEKRDGQWFATGAFEGYANGTRVGEIIGQALTFRVARYVEDGPKDLAKYGLDKPAATLSLGRAGKMTTVTVGGDCTGHEAEVFLRVNAGPVLCAGKKDVEGLTMAPDFLREDRLATADEREVDMLRIEAGDRWIEVRRAGDRWMVKDDDGDVVGDFDSVMAYVRALRFPRAVAFDGAAEGTPLATLTITKHEKPTETVRLISEEGGVAWVRRGGEKKPVQFVGDIRSLFSTTRTRFLSRRMIDERAMDAVSVSRAAGGTTERASHDSGAWELRGTDSLELEGSVIALAVDSLSHLTAMHFDADEPAAKHGLGEPSLVFTVSFESRGATGLAIPKDLGGVDEPDAPDAPEANGPAPKGAKRAARTYTISFGVLADETGVYARVNDGPVAVVERSVFDSLLRSWKRGAAALEPKFASGGAVDSGGDGGSAKGAGRGKDAKRVRRRRR